MTQRLLEPSDAEYSSVGSEYFINNQELQSKVDSLLPSQGGAGAGFDLSASTQIIPIIDLTESAEGSNVRADIQTALSFDKITVFKANGSTVTAVSTTGYYRVFGIFQALGGSPIGRIILNDGTTDKYLIEFIQLGTSGVINEQFDFIVFIPAGHILKMQVTTADGVINGNTRQIADVNGVLTNP